MVADRSHLAKLRVSGSMAARLQFHDIGGDRERAFGWASEFVMNKTIGEDHL
jgi:hypothetical protein